MSKILQVENLVQEFNLTKDFLDKVKFKNGHFSLENRVVHAVNNVSFDVEQGEVFSLVGESGCGKSTTARTIIKLIEPKSGKIIFDGRDITRLKPQEMRPIRREMQMIFQDPYASLNPRQKIMEILTDPMLFHKLCSSKAEAQEKAIHLLERVGLSSEQANRYPHQFSGGQRQRIGIARALAVEPMTNWVIGHTDRFRCAVSQRSIANYVGDYLLSDIGYYYVPDQQLGTIWEHPERLWKASPLTYADRVKTPTLFIHADKDYRCTLANGLEMFAALKLHGVESKLCMFYGENHGLSREGKPSNRISRLSEILRWMDEHLKEE